MNVETLTSSDEFNCATALAQECSAIEALLADALKMLRGSFRHFMPSSELAILTSRAQARIKDCRTELEAAVDNALSIELEARKEVASAASLRPRHSDGGEMADSQIADINDLESLIAIDESLVRLLGMVEASLLLSSSSTASQQHPSGTITKSQLDEFVETQAERISRIVLRHGAEHARKTRNTSKEEETKSRESSDVLTAQIAEQSRAIDELEAQIAAVDVETQSSREKAATLIADVTTLESALQVVQRDNAKRFEQLEELQLQSQSQVDAKYEKAVEEIRKRRKRREAQLAEAKNVNEDLEAGCKARYFAHQLKLVIDNIRKEQLEPLLERLASNNKPVSQSPERRSHSPV